MNHPSEILPSDIKILTETCQTKKNTDGRTHKNIGGNDLSFFKSCSISPRSPTDAPPFITEGKLFTKTINNMGTQYTGLAKAQRKKQRQDGNIHDCMSSGLSTCSFGGAVCRTIKTDSYVMLCYVVSCCCCCCCICCSLLIYKSFDIQYVMLCLVQLCSELDNVMFCGVIF